MKKRPISNIHRMSLKEKFFKLGVFYRWIPTTFLMNLSGKKIIYPFYHHVVPREEDRLTNQIYKTKNEEEFRKDLRYFKKHFKSISFKELLELRKNEKEGFYFFLSFDDGLSNFYKIVTTILMTEEVSAINFINADFVDNKGLFFRYKINCLIDHLLTKELLIEQYEAIEKLLKIKANTVNKLKQELKELKNPDDYLMDQLCKIAEVDTQKFLETERPYMNMDQIQELIQQGFEIGAHSNSHPYYSELTLEEQLKETQESIDFIQKNFHIEELAFAFPFSDDGVSKEFFKRLQGIITFGTAGMKDEEVGINNIQRIPMEHQSVFSAETIIKGELIFYIIKRTLGKHKIFRTIS